MALAALSALALVVIVVAAIYLAAGAGDDGNGGVAGATSTPTRRPTASPSKAPTPALTTPATVTPTPTEISTPSPSPVPGTPRPGADLYLWNTETEEWQDDDLSSAVYSEGDSVLFLLKLTGAKAGESYELEFDYFDCGLSPGQSFDYLIAATGDEPRLTSPGPGRTRPDSQVPVPDDTAIQNETGTGQLLAWGGSFQRSPEFSTGDGACTGDRKLTVSILAQSETLYIEWGAHLASADDWSGKGSSSADSAFGMSAGLAGADETRLEIEPSAVSE